MKGKGMTHGRDAEPLRILLVEDNAADARILEISLQEIPLRTQLMVVDDGDEALAFLRRHPPYVDTPRPDLA